MDESPVNRQNIERCRFIAEQTAERERFTNERDRLIAEQAAERERFANERKRLIAEQTSERDRLTSERDRVIAEQATERKRFSNERDRLIAEQAAERERFVNGRERLLTDAAHRLSDSAQQRIRLLQKVASLECRESELVGKLLERNSQVENLQNICNDLQRRHISGSIYRITASSLTNGTQVFTDNVNNNGFMSNNNTPSAEQVGEATNTLGAFFRPFAKSPENSIFMWLTEDEASALSSQEGVESTRLEYLRVGDLPREVLEDHIKLCLRLLASEIETGLVRISNSDGAQQRSNILSECVNGALQNLTLGLGHKVPIVADLLSLFEDSKQAQFGSRARSQEAEPRTIQQAAAIHGLVLVLLSLMCHSFFSERALDSISKIGSLRVKDQS